MAWYDIPEGLFRRVQSSSRVATENVDEKNS